MAVTFGPGLSAPARARIEELLRRVGDASTPLVISIGGTATTRELISPSDLERLGPEGFIVRSRRTDRGTAIVADGGNLNYAAYALLEELGFGFFHPLAPLLPPKLQVPRTPLNLVESPHWPVRGFHHHTMGPLELTDVLNGWGKQGAGDEAGWQAMLPEWDLFLEWLVANRQNRVEWALLTAAPWQAFAEGAVRQGRLRKLVEMAHAWGVSVGVDVPFAFRQQHAWTLVRETEDLPGELAQIRRRIDWLAVCGFDFLATEIGTSEFTHPDDRRTVAWMNEAVRHLDERYGKRMYIKVHCSTGQEASHFIDPQTKRPVNYNFLPHFADARLGVMPHSVQFYSLTDPAPTYGNTDFRAILEFTRREAGSREVLWHPETSYWVSFDIDVPLFLPVYADRRLYDLRLLAAERIPIRGQMTFSSGWEWGYWLNDVLTARAAWQPFSDEPSHAAARARALDGVVRVFGAAAPEIRDLLAQLMDAERELLIEGRVAGRVPRNIEKRNGQAYLEGWETWDDISSLVAGIPGVPLKPTQPDRVGLLEVAGARRRGPKYAEIEPLLAEMERRFTSSADALEALAPKIPAHARPLYEEITDGARITALRATQIHALYDFACGRRERLSVARAALDRAQTVVRRREAGYRVDPDRIAGWRLNPTAYSFGYLWTVRTLYYWWRDEAMAVLRPKSPAYLNLINPFDVAVSSSDSWTRMLREIGGFLGPVNGITEALAAPAREPRLPPDGLR